MQIKEMDVEALKGADYNPRIELKPGEPEYEALKRNLQEYGMVVPVVWNKRTGNVVSGHQRLSVWKALGNKKAPVSVIDVSPEDEKVINLAMNKISGEWDYDKLEEILASYEMDDALMSGFSADELAIMLAGTDSDFDDDLPEWEDEEPDGFGAYMIQFQFSSREYASEWVEREQLNGKVKPHSKSLLVNMG